MKANSDKTYLEVFNSMEAKSTTEFDCEWPCAFLQSMAEAGMAGFLKLKSDEHVSANQTDDKTEYRTGNIYIELYSCYGRITIHKKTNSIYSVIAESVPEIFKTSKPSDGFRNAIEKMGGQQSGPLEKCALGVQQ